ncbi:hypothetical protein [Peptostreptococcus faecalis]|uniref:hypothetical protein n=1 Tax=Peptostreptococcus faecalis TaxID=2045015 RepID=UPI000C7B3B09|nr:hypothetical protein [Peptostreptococcus faecalis]
MDKNIVIMTNPDYRVAQILLKLKDDGKIKNGVIDREAVKEMIRTAPNPRLSGRSFSLATDVLKLYVLADYFCEETEEKIKELDELIEGAAKMSFWQEVEVG